MIIKQHYEEYKRNIYRSQHTAYRWSFMRYIPAEHWTPITSCFEQFPEPIVNDAYHTHVALDAGCHKQQLFCKFFFLPQKERPPGAAPLPRQLAGPGRPRRALRDNGASTAALTISPRPGGPPACCCTGRAHRAAHAGPYSGRSTRAFKSCVRRRHRGRQEPRVCCCLGLGAGRPPHAPASLLPVPERGGAAPRQALQLPFTPGWGPAGCGRGDQSPCKRGIQGLACLSTPAKVCLPLLLAKLPSLWSKTLY